MAVMWLIIHTVITISRIDSEDAVIFSIFDDNCHDYAVGIPVDPDSPISPMAVGLGATYMRPI